MERTPLYPIQGMESEPEDFPGIALLIYPNLGCPQILTANSENKYVLEGIILAESQSSEANIAEDFTNRIKLQLLIPQPSQVIAQRKGAISLEITHLERWPALPFPHSRFENDGTFNYPRPDVIEIQAFGNRNTFYYARFGFSLPNEIASELNARSSLLFDIVFEAKTGLKWVNFHALCITRNDWQNFTFMHATDLHIAQRNDNILPVIQERLRTGPRKPEKKAEEDDFDKNINDIPLEQRFLNINDNLRRFCKHANRRSLEGDLDLVVLTGDLVDFVVHVSGGESPFKFKLHNSNWENLRGILLGADYRGQEPADECGELLVPCFTVIGNHDYHPWHYSINWGIIYRFLGLTGFEALQYIDPIPANPVGALAHSKKTLTGYFQAFNPWLDFHITLGNNHFLFVDSKADSWVDFRDLLMGSPSLKGFHSDQIQWLQMQAKSIRKGQNVFVLCHGPILNPVSKVKGWEAVKELFQGDKYHSLADLKESAQIHAPEGQRRIDTKMNLKGGCISHNWAEMVEYCLNHTTLVLSGHTHQKLEFRIAPTREKSQVIAHFPFNLNKIPTPAAVFYDDYSDIFQGIQNDSQPGPFLVQTPALGPCDYHRGQRAGAFRVIKVREGKLYSFKVEFLFS